MRVYHKLLWTSCAILSIFSGIGFYYFFTHKSNPSNSEISSKLKSFTTEERFSLEFLFRELFTQDNFSFVIFGNKPMAFSVYSEVPNDNLIDFLDSMYYFNLEQKKGWEIWEKHKDKFVFDNFILKKYKSHVRNNSATIFIINKKNFLKQANKYIDDFKLILGSEITAELLLKRCIETDNIFEDALKNNHALFGILLGFGRNNSWLFQRREEILGCCRARPPLIPRKNNIHSRSFSSDEEELAYIKGKMKSFTNLGFIDCNPLFIHLPSFFADPNDPETYELKALYIQDYKKIISEYRKGDFLEVTLQNLCKK